MKIAYSPRFRMMSWTSARRLSPRRSLATRTRRLSRARRSRAVDPEDAEAGDRTQEVQPAALADEVLAARMRSAQVDREIEQEDDADQVVEDRQRRQRGLAQGEQQQRHDREREDRQDEDEDVVRVAVTARPVRRRPGARCLLGGHRPLHVRLRVASSCRRRTVAAGRRCGPETPRGRRLRDERGDGIHSATVRDPGGGVHRRRRRWSAPGSSRSSAPAGEIAGSAVWISFVLAGVIAALQGYSFAQLGARFPSAGGLLEYINQAFGAATSRRSWPGSATSSTGSSRRWSRSPSAATPARAVTNGDAGLGQGLRHRARASHDRAQHRRLAPSSPASRASIVFVVVGILALFAVVTIANIEPRRCSRRRLPSVRDIISSVALTFFAFLGFGVVTFTARDLRRPVAPAAPGDGHRDRHRDRDLRRGRDRRVRDAAGPRGGRLRGHRDRGRRAARARAMPATG